MHDLALADAARQASVRILRLPMLEYSIGHELTLLSQRNPLLFDLFPGLPEEARRAALIRAALVCHRTWSQQYRRERNMWFWGWLIRKADLEREHNTVLVSQVRRDKLFDLAWEHGHSNGYEEVTNYYSDFVELVR